MSARIFFQDFEFSAGESRPWLAVKRQSVADSPGAAPQKAIATYTVKTWFLEPSFADNQTRYRLLLAALRGATEGVLRMVDENEQEILNVKARVDSDEMPEQWGQNMAEVTVSFTAIEDLSAVASAANILFTPVGAESAITLPNVTHFSEALRADRYSPNLSNRRQTIGTISARGEKLADQSLAVGARRSALLALKATLQGAMDCKEGELVFVDFDKVVNVDVFDANLDDASTRLEWVLQASYMRFPAGDYAEAEFTVVQKDNEELSERLTTVSGKVRADDEAGALAKVAALQAAYATGRVLRSKQTTTPRVSGVDGDDFVDVEFALEFRELLAVTSYKLSVTTKDDTRTGQIAITYSGVVTSNTASAAMDKAEELGDNKFAVRMLAQTVVEVVSVAGSDELLTQVSFSYEYLTKGAALYAEVTSETDTQTFGQNSQMVSGYAVADTQANALALARSFKPSGLMSRTAKESIETLKKESTTLFVKVTFSYAYHNDAAVGSISYGVKTTENLQSRDRTITYSGTAYGPDEDTADGLIDGVIASGQRLANERESKFDKTGSFNKFLSRMFQVTVRSTLTADGEDVLDAEYSVERVFSVDKAILTFIPFGTAHVQTGCGTTIGYVKVSGRVTALTLATAKTWARAKAPTGGAIEEGGIRERDGTRYLPLSGTLVASVSLDFDYAMAFTGLVQT